MAWILALHPGHTTVQYGNAATVDKQEVRREEHNLVMVEFHTNVNVDKPW